VNIENFMMLAKIDLLHVPYKGAGLALNDAVAGQVNAITDNLSSTLPHVKAGRLRALAVLGRSGRHSCPMCRPMQNSVSRTWARAAGSASSRRPARPSR
jgi:hypothetical protein